MSPGRGSDIINTQNPRVLLVAYNFLLACIYFITGSFGLVLSSVSGFAAFVWFPTGISLSAVLILGYKMWPGVFFGALAVNTFRGAPPPVAVAIAIGNTLEALVGAYLLKKTFFKRSLESHEEVLKLVVYAAVFSTLISATIGVSALLLGGVIASSVFTSTWIAWWVGDMVSNLIVAPLILVWSRRPRVVIDSKSGQELVFLFVVLLGIGSFIFLFLGPQSASGQNPPVIYLVFPVLVWVALRFNQKATVSSVFVLSMLAVAGTASGTGPFSSTVIDNLFYLQSFTAVIALTSMILAAVVAERKQYEKQKDNFITIASHELKTPITSIKGFVQLTQKSLQEKGIKKEADYLKRVNNQLNRLANLVNDLLDLSRAQSQRLELKQEIFKLNDLIKDVAEQMGTTTNMMIEIVEREKVKVNADKGRIGQVVTNLLSNAIKYSPKGKKIVIGIKRRNGAAEVSVKDRGIGIDVDSREKIFNLFYRVEDQEAGPAGFGIGLYLSKHIIDSHKGKIWFKSKKGRGSTFYFTLPVSTK